jgi:predicted metalloprotease with PDZ domain
MAGELDRYISEKSNHKKSLRDALIYMLNWTKENKRAFTIEELPEFFQKATGVNVKKIFEKWMKPVAGNNNQ